MDLRHWFRAETWQLDSRLWFLICATFGSYFGFLISTPVTLIAILCLVASLGYAHWQENPNALAVWPWAEWLTLGGLLVAYIAISNFWSADTRATIMTAWLIGALIVVTYGGLLLISRCPTAWLEHMTRTMLIAVIAALSFFIFENLTNHALERVVFWPFRAIRFGADGVWFDRTTVIEISDTSIRWRMPALGFLLWPALLICSLQLKNSTTPVVWCLQAVLVGAAGWMMWYSYHRTSVVALMVAIVVFAAASWRPVEVRRLLSGAWLAGFVLIIPMALMLFSFNLHRDPRLANSLDARIILWAHTAQQVAKHPFRGVGAAATKLLDDRNFTAAEATTPAGFVYLWRTGPHAHNIFLQSWFELGALGTILFAAFGFYILNLTARAPLATQPYLQAAFAAVATTGSASFGLFEPWFMGTFAMCALTCVMAVTYHRRLV